MGVREEQQHQGEDDHARISVPTTMLLRIESARTPNALIGVVASSVTSEMNVNIVVRPVGWAIEEGRFTTGPAWMPSTKRRR